MPTQPKLLAKLKEPNEDWVISYKKIRITVGWLGIALPVLCFFGTRILGSCSEYQYSISDYYYTVMRSCFTGTICAVSLFLFAYRGPMRMDAWMGNLGGIFGLGVAFFPTGVPEETHTMCTLVVADPGTPLTSTLHYISASLFFAVLIVFSLVLFTKGDAHPTKAKKNRNSVFRICGCTMAVACVLIPLNEFWKALHDWWIDMHPVFWLETIALWAFGISWLTKAELIFGDKGKK